MEKIDVEEFYNEQELTMRLSWYYYYLQWEKDTKKVLDEMADQVCDTKTFELYDKMASWFERAKKDFMESVK